MVYFKHATKHDLPRIVEIYNQTIPSRQVTADLKPVSVEDRLSWFRAFDNHHPLWLILSNEDKIIGWVGLEPFYGRAAYAKTSEIAIYIDQSVRHQGVGQQAMDFILDNVEKWGLTAIVAYIFAHNEPSLKLFRHCGFTQWGLLPQVAELDGVTRDLVILGRRFDKRY